MSKRTRLAAWPDDVALHGEGSPENDGHLKYLIEYLLTVYERFGDTAVTYNLQWGASALQKRDKQSEKIVKLETELAAKTAECERLRESQREIAAALGVPGCDAAEMLNVIDSIREDAGRYQLLRSRAFLDGDESGPYKPFTFVLMIPASSQNESFDAAIDAERKRYDLR